jgi:thiamine-monophosphate kinase
MGAAAIATVAVYAAPTFDPDELRSFVRGARDVCSIVDAEYVGGDLDHHDEFTIATTAVGAGEPRTQSGR